ncbi:MAG: hypothetical protein ACLUL2_06240, partial [Blautia sp.]
SFDYVLLRLRLHKPWTNSTLEKLNFKPQKMGLIVTVRRRRLDAGTMEEIEAEPESWSCCDDSMRLGGNERYSFRLRFSGAGSPERIVEKIRGCKGKIKSDIRKTERIQGASKQSLLLFPLI